MTLSVRNSPPPEAGAHPPGNSEATRILVGRIQHGEVDAFESLYRTHVDRIFALCLRMSGDPERATELTQDVFVRCWERIGSFRGDSLFGTWLHRVAVNVVLEHSRSAQRRDQRFETGNDTETLPGVATDPRHDERMDLEQAIRGLPPKARQVFVLHDIEGYRHREIAELTGSAQGTLRAQLHRARKLLMEALS
jgi:RNA polymerase sigma-70 factor (ECF subfamily)